ncbi:hypothetical protein TNCV_3613941 [Trichonephila clavipes]|uniref:Uncharacterized protein n=1 Tax=Trichonephila clavipes TaxID=2585209 RepID=A0A8X6SMT7_TRICX|nr:hypothetical protein TNCV_3613941 [Trichonephila clavipes]
MIKRGPCSRRPLFRANRSASLAVTTAILSAGRILLRRRKPCLASNPLLVWGSSAMVSHSQTWSTDTWKNVTWFDESSFTLFPATGRLEDKYTSVTPGLSPSNCQAWRCLDMGSRVVFSARPIDDNAPFNATGIVHSWFDKLDDEVKHLPWSARSPELSII